jgi:hypothetical protein
MIRRLIPVKPEQKNSFLMSGLIAAALVIAAPASLVLAQGYQGLIPDNSPQPKAAPKDSPADHGYQGLIPPPSQRREAPRGYEGVVPGHVPERNTGIINATPVPDTDTAKAPGATPAPQTAGIDYTPAPEDQRVVAMTPRPGSIPTRPIRTAQDLEDFARLQGFELNLPKLTDEMAARIQVSPKAYSIASSPRLRINGMLPQEAMIKKQIEQVMFSVNMKGLTPEQRRRNARAGYEKLKMFEDGFMHKRSISDEVYTTMGVPGIFVQEQRESTEKSLKHLGEAFKTLKPLQ